VWVIMHLRAALLRDSKDELFFGVIFCVVSVSPLTNRCPVSFDHDSRFKRGFSEMNDRPASRSENFPLS
jgi:hypothetical protein